MLTGYYKKKESFQKRLVKGTKIFLKKKSANMLANNIEIFLKKKIRRSVNIVLINIKNKRMKNKG